MKNKIILVTGSAGFIGFHVSKRLLVEGYSVIGIDNLNDYYDVELKKKRNGILLKNPRYVFKKLDITDQYSLNKILSGYKIQKICHLAAQPGVRYSLSKPFLYEQVNVKGFLSVLEFAREFNIKDVVYASSSAVYGNCPMPKDGFSEADLVNQPISLYGATKRADELMAYAYHNLFGLNCVGLRFFTVYGPWGRPDMAYYSFVKSIMEGKTIDVYNFGKMKRDFTYIDDIVDGIIACLEKTFSYEIFNLGNSHTVKLGYFINCLERILNKKAVINYLPLQKGDLLETYANINNAREQLSFDPKVSIEEGLESFVEWYRLYYSA
jgi:UDP-glucuronate 4-epimerase